VWDSRQHDGEARGPMGVAATLFGDGISGFAETLCVDLPGGSSVSGIWRCQTMAISVLL
jgi:hypothetical protein